MKSLLKIRTNIVQTCARKHAFYFFPISTQECDLLINIHYIKTYNSSNMLLNEGDIVPVVHRLM